MFESFSNLDFGEYVYGESTVEVGCQSQENTVYGLS